jgi:hypothetical protein
MKQKEYSESEKKHIEWTLDDVRVMVRNCSKERMPQGPCDFCRSIYLVAINKAIEAGVYDFKEDEE